MQVPRCREKADNVWTEESWNQFLQELETGQKVRVGLALWEWTPPSASAFWKASSPHLTHPSHPQPKKPLVDDPVEKPAQPIEVSAAWKVGGSNVGGQMREILGGVGWPQ